MKIAEEGGVDNYSNFGRKAGLEPVRKTRGEGTLEGGVEKGKKDGEGMQGVQRGHSKNSKLHYYKRKESRTKKGGVQKRLREPGKMCDVGSIRHQPSKEKKFWEKKLMRNVLFRVGVVYHS